MTVFEAIEERYSYREAYRDTKVPRTDLLKIMEAGLAAPSGCNAQTTYIIGIDDPELLGKAAELLERPSFALLSAGICVITHAIPSYRNTYFNIQDYSAAIENMLLAITGLGYSSCWIEGEITTEKELQMTFAKMLAIPDGYAVVAFLPIGVPAMKGKRAIHKPFGERAFFNGFGKN